MSTDARASEVKAMGIGEARIRSRGVVVGAVLGLALASGSWLVQGGLHARGVNVQDRARLLDDVLTHVGRFYVDAVPTTDLYGKAVAGMVRELGDPHSVLLSPSGLAKLTEPASGRHGDVGVEVDVRNQSLTVLSPLPGAPAERAGMQTGDRIVAVDGKSTRGWSADEARNALRGEPGSAVHILVERPALEKRLEFALTREEIHAHVVRGGFMLRPLVGYVDLTGFNQDAASELRQAIDSLRHRGMQILVLDLRGDAGGLLEQGVAVADLFLDVGQLVVTQRGRTHGADRVFLDRTSQSWPDLKLEVLVDSGSAGAAELIAGALQDHDRAVLLGAKTFGEGSAQSVFPLPNGEALRLTTALWYTPSGRRIDRTRGEESDANPSGGVDNVPSKSPAPPRFTTDSGRTILGGGGITPDVIVASPQATGQEQAFQSALGKEIPRFRDAITAEALSVKRSKAVTSPDFSVTAAMRNALFLSLQQRGVHVDRTVYDSATSLVDRLLGDRISRDVFGERLAFERAARDDATIRTAIDLATSGGVPRTEHELLGRAGRGATRSGGKP